MDLFINKNIELMKKFNLVLLIIMGIQITTAQTTNIELKSYQGIDLETNCSIRYYYYPNIEAYYDTQKNIYYYTENGEWITSEEIPDGYRGYSLNNKLNVAITDYDDENPCQFLSIHKKKYPYTFSSRMKQPSLCSK